MKAVVFYHFLTTKAKEEENTRKGQDPRVLDWEPVERREDISQTIEHFQCPWEIKEVITTKDLGPSIELRPGLVWEHILKYCNYNSSSRSINHQVKISVIIHDKDTETEHLLSFKICTISGRFIIQGNWYKEIVERRGLKEGMLIGMYWNKISSILCFSVLDDLTN